MFKLNFNVHKNFTIYVSDNLSIQLNKQDSIELHRSWLKLKQREISKKNVFRVTILDTCRV